MKTSKSLLVLSMILISLLAIGAASAADSDALSPEITEISTADEIELDDNNDHKNVLSDGESEEEIGNEISVSTKDTPYNEDGSIDISVSNKELITDKSVVNLFVNGMNVANLTLDENRKASYPIPAKSLEAGAYNIAAGLENKIFSDATVLNITKVTPVVSVDDVNVTSGDVITIPFNITDGKGNNVTADVVISIIMEGNSFSKYIENVTGTVASFDMSGMMAMFSGNSSEGGMDWASMFGGNSTNSSNGTGGFDMSKMMEMFGGNSTNSSNGTGGFDMSKMMEMFGGNSTNSSNGTGGFDMSSMMAMFGMGSSSPNSFAYVFEEGTYNITVKALSSRNYNSAVNDTAKLNVVQGDKANINRVNTTIEYKDLVTTSVNEKVDGRIGEYFSVTLKDSNGKALANKFIQIGFNGRIYNRTTDENGSAKLQINLFYTGDYTFAVAYLGDDAFNGSFIVAKITVKKQSAKLTSADASYKANAKTKTIKATLKSAKGNAIPDKKITFTVNGKTYSAKTDSNGVATVKVSLSKKGTYNFTAKYAGDSGYATVSTKGKLTIK